MLRKLNHKRAVFVDRDGVIVKDVNYLTHPKQIHILKGTAQALTLLRKSGFKVIVITNQSAIARGFLTIKGLNSIHRVIRQKLAKQNAKWDALYFSAHGPHSKSSWRKPGIGMLKAAQKRFGIDFISSYFIGDTTTDMLTAKRAGCKALLVKTGKAGKDGRYKAKPDRTFPNFLLAAKWILQTQSPKDTHLL